MIFVIQNFHDVVSSQFAGVVVLQVGVRTNHVHNV